MATSDKTGSAGGSKNSSQLPTEINTCSVVTDTDFPPVTYEDPDENQVVVTQNADTHEDRSEYKLTYINKAGTELASKTIAYGSATERNQKEAFDGIETQLWEWARLDRDKYHRADELLENLGIPDPHPPGERPTVSDQTYYTHKIKYRQLPEPDDYTDRANRRYGCNHTRFEIKLSNQTANWYCTKLVVSFYHLPPQKNVGPTGDVYGATIYAFFYPLKPVDARESRHDTREINREYWLNNACDESISPNALIEAVKEARNKVTDRAEAIDDDRRQQIIKEADRRLNPETGEYEEQARLGSF